MGAQCRFAVGDPEGFRSETWKFWGSGDDAYLISRNKVPTKYSFHKSGESRLAKISPQLNGQQRLIQKWNRPDLGNLKPGEAYGLIDLIFPTSHLSHHSTFYNSRKTNKMFWIPAAPDGMSVGVRVFICNEKLEYLRKLFDGTDHSLVFCTYLRSGSAIGVQYSYGECNNGDLNLPAEGPPGVWSPIFGDIEAPENLPTGRQRDIRIHAFGLTMPIPTIWEFGGYQTTLARSGAALPRQEGQKCG